MVLVASKGFKMNKIKNEAAILVKLIVILLTLNSGFFSGYVFFKISFSRVLK